MKDIIKRDKEENWKKAKNFIPKEHEVIIYDCSDGIKIKIGDGKTKINDLPFPDLVTLNSTESDVLGETIIMKGD